MFQCFNDQRNLYDSGKIELTSDPKKINKWQEKEDKGSKCQMSLSRWELRIALAFRQ